MSDRIKALCLPLLLMIFATLSAGSEAIAQDVSWRVSKMSGDVSVSASGVQPAALTDNAAVKPGDVIRTGQNGRVLLTRGVETILISANSIVGIPSEQKDGLSTTILQQAGTILLDVEKRNVKHFQVETPYLAAVVKGTQFRVTVEGQDSRVEVLRGQVEVVDFKSGQFAQVYPDQTARVSAQGSTGLSLSGSGNFSLIQQGTPRRSSVSPVPAPQQRVAAIDSVPNGQSAPAALPNNVPEPLRAAPRQYTANDEALTDRLVALVKEFLSGDRRRANHSDSVPLDIAVPFAAGVAVTLVVAVKRRRQNRTKNRRDP